MIQHLDFMLAYGSVLAVGFAGLAFIPTPKVPAITLPARRPVVYPRLDEPVVIPQVTRRHPDAPVFCERARRWKNPRTNRFCKAPLV